MGTLTVEFICEGKKEVVSVFKGKMSEEEFFWKLPMNLEVLCLWRTFRFPLWLLCLEIFKECGFDFLDYLDSKKWDYLK
jgi:hypothetical protein